MHFCYIGMIKAMHTVNTMENAYEGFDFSKINVANNAKTYRFQNETGSGETRCYDLIDGVQLSYNNLNMETAYQKIEPRKGMVKIDHCLEGGYEFERENRSTPLLARVT